MPSKATKRLASLRRTFADDIRVNRKHISKFCDDLKHDPFHAFEWGQGSIECAARIRVAQKVLYIIDSLPRKDYTTDQGTEVKGMNPTERLLKLLEVSQQEVNRQARYVPASSSAVSNYAEQHLLAAWATALDKIQWAAAVASDKE